MCKGKSFVIYCTLSLWRTEWIHFRWTGWEYGWNCFSLVFTSNRVGVVTTKAKKYNDAHTQPNTLRHTYTQKHIHTRTHTLRHTLAASTTTVINWPCGPHIFGGELVGGNKTGGTMLHLLAADLSPFWPTHLASTPTGNRMEHVSISWIETATVVVS